MVGGAVASWIAWFAMAGPMFNVNLWHFDNLENWMGSGLGHVGIYVGLGFITGALLTFVLWFVERRTRSVVPEESNGTEAKCTCR